MAAEVGGEQTAVADGCHASLALLFLLSSLIP